MSPLGLYSRLAQGASPGLGIDTHFLSPFRGALPRRKANARAESAAPTELLFFVHAYPGFCSYLWHSRHPGLCRSVVPTALIMRLNFDAVALVALGCLKVLLGYVA